MSLASTLPRFFFKIDAEHGSRFPLFVRNQPFFYLWGHVNFQHACACFASGNAFTDHGIDSEWRW